MLNFRFVEGSNWFNNRIPLSGIVAWLMNVISCLRCERWQKLAKAYLFFSISFLNRFIFIYVCNDIVFYKYSRVLHGSVISIAPKVYSSIEKQISFEISCRPETYPRTISETRSSPFRKSFEIGLLQKSLDNYIVVKDYKNETDGFSVSIGDIVEALEYADPAK